MHHPLINEAVDMGFDTGHAVASLAGFAQLMGCRASNLSVAQHGSAFVDYLFSNPHEQIAAAATPAGKDNTRLQKRPVDHRHADEDIEDDLSADVEDADAEYVVEGSNWPSKQLQQRPQQQHQHQRKRLRRSGEAAAAAAADDDDDDDPAVIIERHRSRVLQGCSRDVHEDSGDPTMQQHCYREQPELDCVTQHPMSAATPTAAEFPSNSRPNRPASTGRNSRFSLQQPGSSSRGTARGKAGSSSTGKHTGSQSKLDMFFTATPAAAVAGSRSTAGARGSIGVGGLDGVLSPVPLGRLNNSSSSTAPAGSLATGGKNSKKPSTFATPAAGFKGSNSQLQSQQQQEQLQLTPLGFGSACTASLKSRALAGHQQQQRLSGAAAGASSRASAPWWAPLKPEDAQLDVFDLVNLKVFGHTGFRPSQKDIVMQAVAGKDLFVLMPTGGGKSLCYQLPAVISRGVTVVVCPLLSLMQDQVRGLCLSPLGGVPASFLSSQQSAEEAVAVKNELRKGRPTVKLLYVTPEQLVKSDSLRSILQGLDRNKLLARFVIDEAHCVSTWGHDFRPDYKKLSILRSTCFKTVPITAVTATATEQVQADIKSTLGITRTAIVHQTSFLRPNLVFKVVPKVRELDDDGVPLFMTKLVQYIKHQHSQAAAAVAAAAAASDGIKLEPGTVKAEPGAASALAASSPSSSRSSCSGIVYCLSRKEAEGVAAYLREQGGIQAGHYHAGMTPKQRMEVQNKFFSGQLTVIVATIAFGMGIDKPDVRFVVHFCISKSLEGYYQEAGRAGRDGLPSECVLMFSAADVSKLGYMARMNNKGKNAAQRLIQAMNQIETMRDYAINEHKRCRHAIMLEYFGVLRANLPSGSCGTSCDVCRKEVIPLDPSEWDALQQQEQADAEECELIDLLDEDEQEVDSEDDGGCEPDFEAGNRSHRCRHDAAAAADSGGSEDLCGSSSDSEAGDESSGASDGSSSDSDEDFGSELAEDEPCSPLSASEACEQQPGQQQRQQLRGTHRQAAKTGSSIQRAHVLGATAGRQQMQAADGFVISDSEMKPARGCADLARAAAAAGCRTSSSNRPGQKQQQQQQHPAVFQTAGAFQTAKQLQQQGREQQTTEQRQQQQQQFVAFQTGKQVGQNSSGKVTAAAAAGAAAISRACAVPKLSRLKPAVGGASSSSTQAAAAAAAQLKQQDGFKIDNLVDEPDNGWNTSRVGQDSDGTAPGAAAAPAVNPLIRKRVTAINPEHYQQRQQQHAPTGGVVAAPLGKSAADCAAAQPAADMHGGWKVKSRPAGSGMGMLRPSSSKLNPAARLARAFKAADSDDDFFR